MNTLHKEPICIGPRQGQQCGDGWRGGKVELRRWTRVRRGQGMGSICNSVKNKLKKKKTLHKEHCKSRGKLALKKKKDAFILLTAEFVIYCYFTDDIIHKLLKVSLQSELFIPTRSKTLSIFSNYSLK